MDITSNDGIHGRSDETVSPGTDVGTLDQAYDRLLYHNVVDIRFARQPRVACRRRDPRFSASFAPRIASTIDSTASKGGARSALSMWSRSAVNPYAP
jgi:hypothetical protein